MTVRLIERGGTALRLGVEAVGMFEQSLQDRLERHALPGSGFRLADLEISDNVLECVCNRINHGEKIGAPPSKIQLGRNARQAVTEHSMRCGRRLARRWNLHSGG